jgi:uncharacterized delta-60 repeat protein/uncharacterized repeat protein (TIGR01451 family)
MAKTLLIRPQQLWLSLTMALILTLALTTASQADGPGDLDPSFDSDGKVTTDFDKLDNGNAIAIQSDGKIVVAGTTNLGTDFALARYNNDGSLDTSFGSNGKVTTDFGTNDTGEAVIIQLDSKIIVAGYSGLSDNYDFALARYNSDGTLDPSFGTSGKVVTNFTTRPWGDSDDVAKAVVIQPDGKIVVAGTSSDKSFTSYDFALARYDSDGSLDTSFGTGGKVTTDLGSILGTVYDYGQAAVLQSDGKIIVAGYSEYSGDADFAVARYNQDGSLDTSFGTNGVVTTNFEYFDQGNATAIQSDGRIIVAGSNHYGTDFALVRYNSNGSLDTSFGSNGKVTTDFGSYDASMAIAIQPNDKIIAVGYTGTSEADFALARYSSDGTLDPSFGTSGKVTTSFVAYPWFNSLDIGKGVGIQHDGKIVVAGYSGAGTDHDFAVARYLGDDISNLTLTKTVQLSNNPIQPGDPLTYTIVVANSGTGTATGVVVSDELPAHIEGSNLNQTVDIAAGASLTFTLNITLSESAPSEEVITNTASFSHSSGSGQDSAVFTVGVIDPGLGPTTIYLPVAFRNYLPMLPTPPTISNIRYVADVNSCTIDYVFTGTLFDVYFDYVDPDGDVIYGDTSGPVDGYGTIIFFPSNESGPIDFDEFGVYGYVKDENDLTKGVVNLDTLCVFFDESDAMRLTFVLKDKKGLESSPLSIDIPRPEGAN